jgi:hypothetical protein
VRTEPVEPLRPSNLFKALSVYSYADKNILLEAQKSSEYEALVLELWLQQWWSLRASFAFCTGSLTDRSSELQVFDLQIIPARHMTGFKRHPRALFVAEVADQDQEAQTLSSDLVKGDKESELRQFFSKTGPEVSTLRAHVFLLTSAYLVSQGSLPISTKLLQRVCDQFPQASQAKDLKSLVLLGGRTESGQAESALTFAATQLEGEALDGLAKDVALGLKEVKRREGYPWDLIDGWLDSKLTSFGQGVLKAIAGQVSSEVAAHLLLDHPRLFWALLHSDPHIALHPPLWRGDASRRLLTSIRFNELPPDILSDLCSTIASSGSLDVIAEAISEIGRSMVGPALASVSDSLRSIAVPWYFARALAPYSEDVFEWLLTQSGRHSGFPINFVHLVDVRALRISAPRFESMATQLDALNKEPSPASQVVLGLVLAIGLSQSDGVSPRLIASSFQLIHDAAERNVLDEEVWEVLDPLMPATVWWRAWDHCERLRASFLDSFSEHQWPLECVLDAVRSPNTLRLIFELQSTNKKRRKFLKSLAKQITAGGLEANAWQRDIAADYV